mgnify:CR=1 FL=1
MPFTKINNTNTDPALITSQTEKTSLVDADKFLINRYLILACFFFALDLWFWHRSILYIGPGMSTLIVNFQIFIIPLLSYFIFNLVPNRYQILAIFLGAFGLYLTLGYGGSFSSENIRLGLIFGILTAFAYSAYILSLKKNDLEDSARISPVISLLCISAISALILLIMVNLLIQNLIRVLVLKILLHTIILLNPVSYTHLTLPTNREV